jgi:hypothetical protein
MGDTVAGGSDILPDGVRAHGDETHAVTLGRPLLPARPHRYVLRTAGAGVEGFACWNGEEKIDRHLDRPDPLAELASAPSDTERFPAVDAAFEASGLVLETFDRFRS